MNKLKKWLVKRLGGFMWDEVPNDLLIEWMRRQALDRMAYDIDSQLCRTNHN